MKFTNVTQLIIKFMGGGLINFPTRFLRWVKINGDTDDSDDGGGGSGNNSNTFFQLATIQPNRYMVVPPDGDTLALIDIENLDLNTFIDYNENSKDIAFFYSKEEISKLGVSLEELEALECSALDNHSLTPTENNSILINNSVITDNFIITELEIRRDDEGISDIDVRKMRCNDNYSYYIMRFAYGDNNNYGIMSFRGTI